MIKYETNSKEVKPGQIFVAITGYKVDGHNYVDEAIKNGASKIVVQRDVKCSIDLEIVKDTEKYLRERLVCEYSHEFDDLIITAVTGTNGKTTTCYLLHQIFSLLGYTSAYLGTIGYITEKENITLENSTPDILTMYKLLQKAVSDGVKCVSIEASSHALVLGRLDGISLDVAAFSNLTPEHLDFHVDMDNYLNAKLMIVDKLDDRGNFVGNSDDSYSKYFDSKNKVSVGKNGDFKILNTNIFAQYTEILFAYNGKEYEVKTPLTTEFNVYNYLTALAMLVSLDIQIDDIINITEYLKAPKGRNELYKLNKGYAVIDYAHTPDSTEKMLISYNKTKTGKLITLVGCGGDRDRTKRPVVGKLATSLSDYVVFTNDNPRTEDEQTIMDDILKGVVSDNYIVELDRKKAIQKAISMLDDEDILLVLGKGHEEYQIVGVNKIHFSDKEVIMNAL